VCVLANGITLSGFKFMCIKAENDEIVGRKGVSLPFSSPALSEASFLFHRPCFVLSSHLYPLAVGLHPSYTSPIPHHEPSASALPRKITPSSCPCSLTGHDATPFPILIQQYKADQPHRNEVYSSSLPFKPS
jgi:hypothetical protein